MLHHHRQYLFRTRAACALDPRYHRHQLAALDHRLGLADRAGDELLELARAAALDRAANEVASSLAHDDSWSAAAAGIEYLHALEAVSHADLIGKLHAAKQKGQAYREVSANVHGAFARLALSFLHANTSTLELGEAMDEIAHAFGLLRQSDPAFAPESWLAQPRYRLRVPWSGGIPETWMAPYWEASADPPDIPADPSAVLADAEQKWRAGLSRPTEPWPAVQPWPCPERFAALAHAESQLLRETQWCDSILARHWHNTVAALEPARTATGLQAILCHFDKRLDIDATWNMLLLATLLAPLRAAAIYGWSRRDADRDGIGQAAETVQQLLGLGPVELLKVPRVENFLRINLQSRLDDPNGLEGFGACHGEGGFELVKHCLAWRDAGANLDDPWQAFANVFEALGLASMQPLDPQPVHYWSRRYRLR